MGEVDARPRAARLRRRSSRVRQDPGTARLRRQRRPGEPRHRVPRGRPLRGERDARARGRARRASAASAPPALYSFDPDTGRLAVTTPAYNTAIVAVNQHAFPYGGLDLARLYDGDQEVAANIGGTGAAGFGLVARAGSHVLRTQYGRALVRGRRRAAAADAGAARRRRERGRGGHARLRRAVHRPARARNGARARDAGDQRLPLHAGLDRRALDAARAGGRTRHGHLPELGRTAHVLATLADGRTVALGHAPLAGVRAVHVLSEHSGYRVTLRGAATVRLVTVRPQSSQPDPGPSVAVSLARTTLARPHHRRRAGVSLRSRRPAPACRTRPSRPCSGRC